MDILDSTLRIYNSTFNIPHSAFNTQSHPVREPGPPRPPREEPPDAPPPREDPPREEPPQREPEDDPRTDESRNDTFTKTFHIYKDGDAMMTLLAGAVFTLLILTAVYAFGVFGTPYLHAFRFAFYLILLMFIVVMVFAIGNQPFEGYDPTPDRPR